MTLEELNAQVTLCRHSPRLAAWREEVAANPRASYASETYWGRPVPGFGDPHATLLLVGLAPGAHGANRTGRMFTGDRSGDWLYRAMHRAGFASQRESLHRDDGLTLENAYITAVVRCAPPDNRPTTEERDNCIPYLVEELRLLSEVKVVVALGGFAWDGCLRALATVGHRVKPKPRFGHGAEVSMGPYTLVGSYHPSQQNTFTGRLTEPMLDAVFARAHELTTT